MFSWLFGKKRDNPETSSEEQDHIDDCDEPVAKIKKSVSVNKKPKSRSKDDSDMFTESELSEDTEDEERSSHRKKCKQQVG